MYNYNPNPDSQMYEDIRELCICSAKAVTVIAGRYNEDPRLVSKLYIEVYKTINDMLEKSKNG